MKKESGTLCSVDNYFLTLRSSERFAPGKFRWNHGKLQNNLSLGIFFLSRWWILDGFLDSCTKNEQKLMFTINFKCTMHKHLLRKRGPHSKYVCMFSYVLGNTIEYPSLVTWPCILSLFIASEKNCVIFLHCASLLWALKDPCSVQHQMEMAL